MRSLTVAAGFLVCASFTSRLVAQGVPNPASTLNLSGYDLRGSGVPAHTNTTLLTFTVEGDSTGNNAFEVATSDPGVAVSLILPSGTEVTSSNAVSFGFTFTIIPEGSPAPDVLSTLSLPGTHTFIQIPSGQVSGVYKIRADATNAASDSGILATYYSSSNVRTAATTNAAEYKTGDTVILSGLVFDGTAPVTGATVTAAVSTPVSLAGQTSVGNYQLLSQQQVAPNLTDYTYSATLTNTGPAAPEVQAELAALPANVTILSDTLAFGSVAANSTATSVNRLIIERDPSQPFDPATLQWNVTSPGTPVNVTLTDSGAFDAAGGDGIYTGTFTPGPAGVYTALLSITGTSLAGSNFSRTAAAQFKVGPPLASFSSFTDTQQPGGVMVAANVNIQTAGTYRLTMQLQANNQKAVQSGATATLSAGSQQIAVTFSNSQLFGLGVNGPYERVNALLVYVGSSGDSIADSRADAGPTAAYTLSSVAPGLYFTGQNSAAGVITGAGPTFDLLRVTASVFNASTRSCAWNARLTDAAGNRITDAAGSGQISAGATFITFDFNGNSIARAGAGPYLVKRVGLICYPDQAATQFSISGFTASQFTSVAADFTLSLAGSAPSGRAGSPIVFPLQLSSAGDFQGNVIFSVAGLPAGATGAFDVPAIVSSGKTSLTVTTPASLAAGAYPFNVGYSSGNVSKTLALTLAVTASAATPTVTFTGAPASAAYLSTFTGAPASAAYLSTFTVATTTNASTTAVITASGPCSISGNVVSITSGTGTCQLTANWAADQNFVAATATQTTTATKAAATVSLNAASLTQTYDGTGKAVTATTSPSGLALNVTYNGSNTAPINAGSYTVVATINDPNYQGTATGTLQINKAALTVTANNASRTYGAANPTFTASYSGFLNGDTFANALTGSPGLTTAATASSLPGSYAIVAAQGTLSAANYAFSFVNGTLTITPTGAAPASGTTCNGAYNGTFNGNLTLSTGQTCIFVSGGITGNATTSGGSFTLIDATAGGNVTGQGNVTLSGAARVNGSVTLTGGQLSVVGGAAIGEAWLLAEALH